MLAVSLLFSTGAFGETRGTSGGHAYAKQGQTGGDSRNKVSRVPSPSVDSTFARAADGDDDVGVCPHSMRPIGRSFCIDTYEASLVELAADGSERPWPYFKTVPAGVRVRAISVADVYPQGYISGIQAGAACRESGKRLCKPAEWKNACMGPKRTTYPYGATQRQKACNDHGRSPMIYFFHLDGKPENAWQWGFNGNMMDPRLNQLDGTLAKTGEHPDCTNEYGVFDMVGNLHEWVDDPDGTFQGGYYLDTHINGDGCNYQTTAHTINHLDYSTGFRCCADMEE